MAKLDMNDFSNNQAAAGATYSDKKLRIGIIGTGGISGSHIEAYMNQPDVEIVDGECAMDENGDIIITATIEVTIDE